MEVTLISPLETCEKCETMHERLENISLKFPGIELKKVAYERNNKSFINYSTPIIMIDDCVVSSGKVIPEDFLEEYIKNQLSFSSCQCTPGQADEKDAPGIRLAGTCWHILPYKDKYLALDINTSRCMEMDAYGFKVFKGEIEQEDEMSTAVKEYNTLKYIDYFNYEDFTREIPDEEAVVRSINLTIPNKCNLQCQYCYSTNHKHISDQEVFRIIDRLIERFVVPVKNKRFIFNFSLFGEVLMCIPLLKELKNYLKEKGNIYGKKLASRFNATNATLLSEEKARELWELSDMGEINISIDGPAHIQDEVRRFPNGEGTYRFIEDKIKDCVRKWPSVASAVLNGRKPHVTEIFLHLYNLGFRLIRIKPIRAAYENPFAITKNNIEKVKEEYTNFVRFLISRDDTDLLNYISCIDGDDFMGRFFFTLLRGVVTKYRCPALKDTIVVNSKGDIYSCQSMIGFDEFKVGNIFDDENAWKESRRALLDKIHVQLKDDCSTCWALKICGGGCIHCGWLTNKSFQTPDRIKCELIRHVIEQAMILLSELRNRPVLSRALDTRFRSRDSLAALPSGTAVFTSSSPIQDKNQWGKADIMYLNRDDQLRGAVNRKEIFTGNVAAMWDTQYFYIRIELVNGKPVTSAQQQENIVRFTLNDNNNPGNLEYGIGIDKGKPVLYRLYLKDTTKDFLGFVETADISIEVNDDRMIYQAAVPWEEFNIEPEGHKSMRFNVVLYEREHPYPFVAKWWWEWAPGMVVEMNPGLFGNLVLQKNGE